MPRIKLLVTAILLTLVQTVFAQGTRISGKVSDDFGPVMMANVVERDANNRIVTAAVTDVNGNFSMVVKNTKNKLSVSYVGAKPIRAYWCKDGVQPEVGLVADYCEGGDRDIAPPYQLGRSLDTQA